MRYKKIKSLSKNIKEDLIFAKRTEEAWKRYKKGEFVETDLDNFLKFLEKW